MSPVVKQADLIMLATERRDLFIDDDSEWAILRGIQPTDEFIISPCYHVRQESCLWSVGMNSNQENEKRN
jgi:hypothetical protein